MSDDQQQPPEESSEAAPAPETPAAEEASTEATQAAPDPQGGGGQIPGADKKVLAGILGIVLGAFGIHKFILGYNKEAVIMLVVSVLGLVLSFLCIPIFATSAMSIIGLIEGIMYLTKSDEEFVNTYIKNQKPWF